MSFLTGHSGSTGWSFIIAVNSLPSVPPIFRSSKAAIVGAPRCDLAPESTLVPSAQRVRSTFPTAPTTKSTSKIGSDAACSLLEILPYSGRCPNQSKVAAHRSPLNMRADLATFNCGEALCHGANVSRIASAASAKESDALCPCVKSKIEEFMP